MPIISKSYLPCTCMNQHRQIGTICAPPFPGCECPPCGWSINWGCEIRDSTGEKWANNVSILMRDCPDTSTYTSRWIPDDNPSLDEEFFQCANCIDNGVYWAGPGKAPKCPDDTVCKGTDVWTGKVPWMYGYVVYEAGNSITVNQSIVDVFICLQRDGACANNFLIGFGSFADAVGGWAMFYFWTGPNGELVYDVLIPTSLLSGIAEAEQSYDADTNTQTLIVIAYSEADTAGRHVLWKAKYEGTVECESTTLSFVEYVDGHEPDPDFGESAIAAIERDIVLTKSADCTGSQLLPSTSTGEEWAAQCWWKSSHDSLADACSECVTKQSLNPETKTLTITTRSGHSAVYTTDADICDQPFNMTRQSMDFEMIGAPQCICVSPVYFAQADWSCAKATCDDGRASVDFQVGNPYSEEEPNLQGVYICEDLAISSGFYSFQRGMSGAPPEVRVAWGLSPTPEPGEPYNIYCNAFWREFTYSPSVSCDKWPGKLLIVVEIRNPPDEDTAPQPTDTHSSKFTIFCWDAEAGEEGAYVSSYVDSGEAFRCCTEGRVVSSIATLPNNVECCCSGVACPACGETTIPSDLTWEISGAGCITGSTSGVMTWVETDGTWSWDNPSATGCQIYSVRMYCGTFSGEPGVRLDVTLLTASYGKNVLAADMECDPFEVAATLDEIFNVGCCSGTTSISMTVTLAT